MLLIGSILAGAVCHTSAVAAEDFVPPQKRPDHDYEAGWNKNPFTLKTASIAVVKDSFAKDLVLFNSYSIGDKRTVILANQKTKERIRLVGQEPNSTGIKVKTYHHGEGRKDTFVEVEAAGEVAVLRFDEGYLKQSATGGGKSAAPDTSLKTDNSKDASSPAASPPASKDAGTVAAADPLEPIPGQPRSPNFPPKPNIGNGVVKRLPSDPSQRRRNHNIPYAKPAAHGSANSTKSP